MMTKRVATISRWWNGTNSKMIIIRKMIIITIILRNERLSGGWYHVMADSVIYLTICDLSSMNRLIRVNSQYTVTWLILLLQYYYNILLVLVGYWLEYEITSLLLFLSANSGRAQLVTFRLFFQAVLGSTPGGATLTKALRQGLYSLRHCLPIAIIMWVTLNHVSESVSVSRSPQLL